MPENTYHHENLRQTLLDVGEKLLETEGSLGLTLRGLARAAGVSHAAPYRHFADKPDLLEALAARGFNRLTEEAARIKTDASLSPRERFLALCRNYVRLGSERPAMYRLMFGKRPPLEQMETNRRAAGQGAFDALVTTLRAGQETGFFREGSATDMAITVWALLHGLTDLTITGRLSPTVNHEKQGAASIEQACALLLSGLLAPDPAAAPSPAPRPSGSKAVPSPGSRGDAGGR